MKTRIQTILTVTKYLFSFILTILASRAAGKAEIFFLSAFELLFIIALTEFLIRKSKWFGLLSSLLLLLFNAQNLVYFFGNNYILLVMLQNLYNLADLQGNAFVYILGVVLVLLFSFYPAKKLLPSQVPAGRLTLTLLLGELCLFVSAREPCTPSLAYTELYGQYANARKTARLAAEIRANAEAATESKAEESTLEDTLDPSYRSGVETLLTSEEVPEAAPVEASSDEEVAETEDKAANEAIDLNTETKSDAVSENISEEETLEDEASTSEEEIASSPNIYTYVEDLPKGYADYFTIGEAKDHPNWGSDMNIILIFVEGLSKSIITDDRGLMPNAAWLKGSSYHVYNYYNHTFATFRGIQGQLYSGYSLNDTDPNHLTSLMDVLRGKGYYTAFINSEPTNSIFSRYLKDMSFDTVTDRTDLVNPGALSISDKDSYQLLFDTATSYQASGKKFFLTFYSFGTHASLDSPDEIWGDGTNAELNKFHNLDCQLGTFLTNFLNSSLASNTMLIFTSDHATYADAEFSAAFPNKKRGHGSCDQIPLFIYYKGKTGSLDAQGRNSLDFAPTLLDLMGLESPECFAGVSLFHAKNTETVMDNFFWDSGSAAFTGNNKVQGVDSTLMTYITTKVATYCAFK